MSKLLKNFCRTFLPQPDPRLPTPASSALAAPVSYSLSSLLATSPHLHTWLSGASQKGGSLTSPASYCPGSTAATPVSPPSRPASQPAAPWPRQPPLPTPPRPREDQAGCWQSPCLLSLPPSLPLPPYLPPSLLRPPLRQGPCKSRRGGTDRQDGVQLRALGSQLMPHPG